ncbi:hypothetical protein B0H34DRAFT_863602 [Crassisporium funariophilum]|nr:hypothetical protein B0H34DRAFT_863602 [Crassisporium funariophilum]
MVGNMKHVLQHSHNPQADKHVVKAFGRLKIPTADAVGTGFGSTDMHAGHVAVGFAFHSRLTTDKERAGTTPRCFRKKTPGSRWVHLDLLKNENSANLYHNADAYRVFAESCSRRLRRPFEETDPVKREYLISRNSHCTEAAAQGKSPAEKHNAPAVHHNAPPAHHNAPPAKHAPAPRQQHKKRLM